MGEKSIQKRKFILDTARKVFMEKGFKRVTMKDIVEACNISRGGLYLHFADTESVFSEILHSECKAMDIFHGEDIDEDATAADILILFLKEQKKQILQKENSLDRAIYEFYFDNEELPKKDNLLKQQFDTSVLILQKLIETGVENGEFVCKDCEGKARSIMYILDGMKINARTIGITGETVDKELLYILSELGL